MPSDTFSNQQQQYPATTDFGPPPAPPAITSAQIALALSSGTPNLLGGDTAPGVEIRVPELFRPPPPPSPTAKTPPPTAAHTPAVPATRDVSWPELEGLGTSAEDWAQDADPLDDTVPRTDEEAPESAGVGTDGGAGGGFGLDMSRANLMDMVTALVEAEVSARLAPLEATVALIGDKVMEMDKRLHSMEKDVMETYQGQKWLEDTLVRVEEAGGTEEGIAGMKASVEATAKLVEEIHDALPHDGDRTISIKEKVAELDKQYASLFERAQAIWEKVTATPKDTPPRLRRAEHVTGRREFVASDPETEEDASDPDTGAGFFRTVRDKASRVLFPVAPLPGMFRPLKTSRPSTPEPAELPRASPPSRQATKPADDKVGDWAWFGK